jgi:HMG (high mobility group) box
MESPESITPVSPLVFKDEPSESKAESYDSFESIPDAVLFEILIPLIEKRPALRREVASILVQSLAKHIEPLTKLPTSSSSRPTSNNSLASLITTRKTAIKDPGNHMFYKIRRLVMLSQKSNLKESEIEKALDDEWTKMPENERNKWQQLAEAESKRKVS